MIRFYGYLGLILSLIGTTAGTGHAQRLLAGVKGGAALTSGVGADAEGSAARFAPHGGAFLRGRLYRSLALQVEGNYVQRGDNSLQYGPAIMHRLDYVRVPVLLQYHWNDVFFEAGPDLGYLLRATSTLNLSSSPAVFRTRDLGFAAGFGYQDSTGFLLGWRYNGGLRNIYRRVDLVSNNQVQLRNSALEFYLGYVFNHPRARRRSR